MKTARMLGLKVLVVSLQIAGHAATASAQPQEARWSVQPLLSLGKYLPGEPIERSPALFFPGFGGTQLPDPVSYRYEGTTLGVAARLYPPSVDWAALTLSGGVTWFYASDDAPITSPEATESGIGRELAPADFVSFPLSVGVLAVFPGGRLHEFALFAGFEAVVHFVSGDVPVGRQVQPGYGVSAGFAVKVFEFGLRYQAYSDMRNLGAYGGIRFSPFDL